MDFLVVSFSKWVIESDTREKTLPFIHPGYRSRTADRENLVPSIIFFFKLV